MKKRLPVIVLIAAAIVAGALVWRFLGETADADSLRLYGNVDIREVALGFRVPGALAVMAFEEGDTVSAGSTLAQLDPEPYREDVQAAQAAVSRAEAQLRKLRAGRRPQEVRRAESRVTEARAVHENATRILTRQKELIADGAGTQRALDQAIAEERAAAARLDAALQDLELAREGFRSEDIAAAEAALDAEHARLAQARTRLADTQMTAPADGVILSRAREPGTILAVGMPVYTLSLGQPVWVRAYIDEPDLGRIHPGNSAWISTDGSDKRYRGQVGFISPRAEFTPKTVETEALRTSLVYRLRIVVEDADEALRQGMPVTVTFDDAPDGA